LGSPGRGAGPYWILTFCGDDLESGLRSLQNVINGERRDAADGRTSEVIDPTKGQPYANAPVSGEADIDAAMDAAAAAFEKWRETTPSERQKALLRIADAIEARADDIVKVESENTGKPIGADHQRGVAAGDRPDPVLRRCCAGPGWAGIGGVPGRAHVLDPP